jgi:hypothetical protein
MSAPPGFDWGAEKVRKAAAQLSVFGKPCTYSPGIGSPYDIYAIVDFSERAQLIDPGCFGTAWSPLSSFVAEPKTGDSLSIDGTPYRVYCDASRKFDGSVGVTLVLRKQ